MIDSNTNNNQGVVITGGTVNVDQLTVGTKARSEKIIQMHSENDMDIENLKVMLDGLIEVLHENNTLFKPEVIESVELVKAEANKEAPNKLVMVSVLEAVADTAKAFVPILEVVKSIKTAVLSLL